MSDLRFSAKPPEHTEIPRPKRGEGQWALGYTEPLNKNEQSKKDDDPLNVRDRILQHLLQARLRLDRPGRPARPVPLDGPLHPARPGLRRRQDRDARGGGARRRVLHAAGPLRRPAAAPPTPCARWARSASSTPATPPTSPTARTSSTTGSASRTSPRSGRGSTPPGWTASRPAATRRGRSSARRSPAWPRTRSSTAPRRWRRSSAATSATRRSRTCPRKFKTALTGHPSHDVSPETNDVAFVGTVHPEHGPGFDLWVGGGLSTNPMLAQKLGVWIPTEDVPDVWEGVAVDLPRLRLPPAALARPAEVPGRRLGRREVPRGARERVPRPRAGLLRVARLPHRPPRPRRRARAEGRQLLRRPRARSPAGSPAPCWSRWPT